MDTVTIIRRLWRLRVFVAATAIFAILVGLFITFRLPSLQRRSYTVGVGSVRILVDTPASQVVDLSPKGSDSLGFRATLLSNLMVEGQIKDLIAKRAGLRPDQLIGSTQNSTTSGLSKSASTAATPTRDSYVLSTHVTMVTSSFFLPIIEVATQAPDTAGAQRLADAAAQGLSDYLSSKAAAEAVPNGNRLRLSSLGTAQAGPRTQGPGLTVAVAAVILVFALGCALILAISGILRGLRAGEDQPAFVEEVDDTAADHSDHQPAPLYELDRRRAARHPDPDAGTRSAPPVAPPAPRSSSWWASDPT